MCNHIQSILCVLIILAVILISIVQCKKDANMTFIAPYVENLSTKNFKLIRYRPRVAGDNDFTYITLGYLTGSKRKHMTDPYYKKPGLY